MTELPPLRHRAPPTALILLVLMLVGPYLVQAQHVPRDGYLRFVPLEVPRSIKQTPASATLHLYGDRTAPDYVDVVPVDGIDDRRFAVLHELGVRFAPFLVQNSELIPMDFRRFPGRGRFPLFIDTWNTAMNLELVREESIDWLSVASEPCTPLNPTADDCRLLELLRDYHPDRPRNAYERTAAIDAPDKPFQVLFVDLPGQSPKSWKREFENEFSSTLRPEYRGYLKTFVHPFLEEVPGTDEPRYQLVLQYWFYYPYNDGGNNHEGDWEHIHVIVAPLDRVTEPGLIEREMLAVLDGVSPSPLVMKRVEYYFHNQVMLLDFSAPNAYAPLAAWRQDVASRGRELSGIKKRWAYARYMAYRDREETQINTHPVGYIGADNKGLDQLLSPPGGTNRDSHGTYPQPGLYKGVGPAGAAEAIGTSFDHRDFYAATPAERAATLTEFQRGGVVFLGRPELVELVPDYERVLDLVLEDVDARQQWAWLVLPIRWGYPAVSSPLAGVVGHAETGNLGPVGPAFNPGWNRAGENVQYRLYDPHVLPRLWPVGLQDAFLNDWGFLNATLPAVSFLPPFDLLWRVVAAPFRLALTDLDPSFFPEERIPFRFVGLNGGITVQNIPKDDYTELFFNRIQFPLMLTRLVEFIFANSPDSIGNVTEALTFGEKPISPLFQVQFFIGDRVTSTNTVRHSRSELGFSAEFAEFPEVFTIESALNLWEYAGSLRYNLLTGGIQPFVKGGWGLSWYRLENVRTNGQPLDEPNSNWIRKPGFFENLLPNTWHFGLGVELIPIKSFARLPGGIDVSLSAEWLNFTNKLGLDISDIAVPELLFFGATVDELPREHWVNRGTFNFALTFSL